MQRLKPDNTTTWTYDYNGNTKTVTDRLGAITRYFYDGMNRLVRIRNTSVRVIAQCTARKCGPALCRLRPSSAVDCATPCQTAE